MQQLSEFLMRCRYYSPSIGRFINKDPIGLAGGMNLYGYAEQSPIGHVDPRGLLTYQQTASRITSVIGLAIAGTGLFIANPMLAALGASVTLHAMLIEPSRPIGLILAGSGLIVGTAGFMTGNPFLISLGISLAIHGFVLDLPPPTATTTNLPSSCRLY